MKQEHLFESIGLVEDYLIEEAADARRMASPWKKWVATAATLVIVVGISSVTFISSFGGCRAKTAAPMDSAADSAVTVETPAEMPESSIILEAESADTPETPIESAEESATSDLDSTAQIKEETDYGNNYTYYDGPILTLSTLDTQTEALYVSRSLSVNYDESIGGMYIHDAYSVTNTATEPQAVSFAYPVVTTRAVLDSNSINVSSNGVESLDVYYSPEIDSSVQNIDVSTVTDYLYAVPPSDANFISISSLPENDESTRLFYVVFETIIPAEDVADISVNYTKTPSFSTNPAMLGFDLLTTAGSSLNFDAQYASLILPEDYTIRKDGIGLYEQGGGFYSSDILENDGYYSIWIANQ